MIEIPGLPTARVVAGLALASKCTFVVIVAIVAFCAKRRRIFVRGGTMARLALGSRVRSGQLESGFAMVVNHPWPFLFVVAGLTSIPQLTFVHIVLAMTRETIHGQGFCPLLDVQLTGVTRGALCNGVLVLQPIAG